MIDQTTPDVVKQAFILHGVVSECPVCGDSLSDGDHSGCAESLRVVAVGRRKSINGRDFMGFHGEHEQKLDNSREE